MPGRGQLHLLGGMEGGARLEGEDVHAPRAHVLQAREETAIAHGVGSHCQERKTYQNARCSSTSRWRDHFHCPISPSTIAFIVACRLLVVCSKLAWLYGAGMCTVTLLSCLAFVLGTAPELRCLPHLLPT